MARGKRCCVIQNPSVCCDIGDVMFRVALLFLALLLVPSGVAAENRFDISVITVGPGRHLFTRFGHIALLTDDHQTGIKKVYNFGEFDFHDPALRTKYLRGDLAFWLEISAYETFMKNTKKSNRRVTLRALEFSGKQTQEIVAKLKRASTPKNRYYRYNHYTNNCCTKVRDLIDEVTDGLLLKSSQYQNHTYRYWTDKCLAQTLVNALFMFALGPNVDEPINRWQAQFLPSILSADLDRIHLSPNQKPLVKKKTILHHRREDTPSPALRHKLRHHSVIFGFLALLLICFVCPILRPKKSLAVRLFGVGVIVWGLVGGLSGLFLTILFLATGHTDTFYNENLALFPPTHLLLVVPGSLLLIKSRLSAVMARSLNIYLVVVSLFAIADIAAKLGPSVQANLSFIPLCLAGNIAVIVALKRIKRAGER